MNRAKKMIDFINEKHDLQVGDKVKLHPEALLRHAKSVPAHAGYSKEQFAWRDVLNKLEGKVGTIERLFPNSNHVNVEFEDGQLIGIDAKDVVKEG